MDGPEGRTSRLPNRLRGRLPLLTVLLLAPFFGECLSGATPPLDLLLPWRLALLSALYGCGALICREVARRWSLRLPGLLLLGAAYGVYEEALVDRYWFFPRFWDDVGVGSYSVVWHTNVLLAFHLTAFHAAVSIGASVLVVERIFPAHRGLPWVGRSGLVAAALALGIVVPLVYGEFERRPPVLVLLAAAALCAGLVCAAFWAGRLPGRVVVPGSRRRRGLGAVAFSCTTSHFVIVYGVPSTGIPWPIGVLLSLVPIALGVLLVARLAVTDAYGRDGMRVIAGMVAFFVLLDVVAGLGGRYDFIVGALATVGGLVWLVRSSTPRPSEPADSGPV